MYEIVFVSRLPHLNVATEIVRDDPAMFGALGRYSALPIDREERAQPSNILFMCDPGQKELTTSAILLLPSPTTAVMTSELIFSSKDGGKTFTRRFFGLEAFLGTIAHVSDSSMQSRV